MHLTILSRQHNQAAQIFCADFGVVRSFTIKKESELHDALSLLFHRDGVPNVMVVDVSKAQTEWKFRRKMRDPGCHIKKTQPHAQSSNLGEGGVRELKIGGRRKILRAGCPKRL
jgi:hypothetical protein